MPLLHDHDSVVQKKFSVESLPADFIPRSPSPTSAQVLWIGCSDSWDAETEVLNLAPEEIVVHRSLGNIVSNGDLSSAGAIKDAVDNLKVKHLVVCGHYDCSLIEVDKDEAAAHTWYQDMKKLHEANEKYLGQVIEIESEVKDRHLAEVYVLAEVERLRAQPVVRKATRERGLQVHAVVFDQKQNASFRLVETDPKRIAKKKSFPSRCGTHECTGSCFRSQLAKDTAF